jgi:D-ribose pyranase
MRTDGLWHPRLLSILTAAGHGDAIVVADAGLPVPVGIETVDLLWQRGEPAFLPVLRAVLAECVVEHALAAHEVAGQPVHDGLRSALAGIPLTYVSHLELKQHTAAARVIIRTGEATPYANAVLRCGVAF